MKEPARLQRNRDRLAELFPAFRERLGRVLRRLEKDGVRPRIQEAWRSPEDQLAAWKAHHSQLKYGFHNVTGPSGAKEALAADVLDDNAPTAPRTKYLLQLAAAAEAEGLVTGIRWSLPAHLIVGIDAAIAARDWNAPVKVGWDPTHVEISGITVAQVKAGQRPF